MAGYGADWGTVDHKRGGGYRRSLERNGEECACLFSSRRREAMLRQGEELHSGGEICKEAPRCADSAGECSTNEHHKIEESPWHVHGLLFDFPSAVRQLADL